jgi:hypothetical protein
MTTDARHHPRRRAPGSRPRRASRRAGLCAVACERGSHPPTRRTVAPSCSSIPDGRTAGPSRAGASPASRGPDCGAFPHRSAPGIPRPGLWRHRARERPRHPAGPDCGACTRRSVPGIPRPGLWRHRARERPRHPGGPGRGAFPRRSAPGIPTGRAVAPSRAGASAASRRAGRWRRRVREPRSPTAGLRCRNVRERPATGRAAGRAPGSRPGRAGPAT